MAYRVRKYLHCPECAKKGVTRRDSTSEDHWACRYCDWRTFAYGEDQVDVEGRLALRNANPAAAVWVTNRPGELNDLWLGPAARTCTACRGVCEWSDDAWVCLDCGDEWSADWDEMYAAPGDTASPVGHVSAAAV